MSKMRYFVRIVFTLFFFFSFIKKDETKWVYPQWQNPPFAQGVSVGKLEDKEINETSGLVASRNNPRTLWIHNDSGDEARFFLISESAAHLATFYLKGATHRDWEDMAISTENGKNYLFLGDIGDNLATSETKVIYKVPEPIYSTQDSLVEITLHDFATIRYRYPDGNRDSECLMIDPQTNDLFVISKREENVNVYVAPYPQSTSEIITLTKVCALPFRGVVAGDISPDGKEVLLKDYKRVFYWKKENNESIGELLQKRFQNLPYIHEPQGEAVAWKTDGTGYFTLSEGRYASLLFYQRK
jgi:hypothetical protein